jgi:hypothetical protein
VAHDLLPHAEVSERIPFHSLLFFLCCCCYAAFSLPVHTSHLTCGDCVPQVPYPVQGESEALPGLLNDLQLRRPSRTQQLHLDKGGHQERPASYDGRVRLYIGAKKTLRVI